MYTYDTFAVTLQCPSTQPGQKNDTCTAVGKRDNSTAEQSAPMDTIMLVSGLLVLAAALIVLIIIRRQASSKK